ncbi:hypothetical protein BGW80DRAFT_1293384 [Lactifluus volemus]|nr:hypothetical protein BGW80DRAFT_1293384 [Lactifluus volemus]
MLFFKLLTALLVPLAASAVPTSSSNSDEPHMGNLNNITAEAYNPSASNLSRNNTKFTTRQGVASCDCSVPQSDCAEICFFECNRSLDCMATTTCCSDQTGSNFIEDPSGM